MYNKRITVYPDKPNFPPDPLWVGTNSCILLIIDGLPTGFKSARLYLTKVGGTIPVYFDASISTTGEVYFYMGGSNFPTAGETGRYEIEFVDAEDHTYWTGYNTVHVWTANVSTTPGGLGTASVPYYQDALGKWHRVFVQLNEFGEYTTAIDQTGIDLV